MKTTVRADYFGLERKNINHRPERIWSNWKLNWSPDGRWLNYSNNRDRNTRHIFIGIVKKSIDIVSKPVLNDTLCF
jgi:hypothetical protein